MTKEFTYCPVCDKLIEETLPSNSVWNKEARDWMKQYNKFCNCKEVWGDDIVIN